MYKYKNRKKKCHNHEKLFLPQIPRGFSDDLVFFVFFKAYSNEDGFVQATDNFEPKVKMWVFYKKNNNLLNVAMTRFLLVAKYCFFTHLFYAP